MTGNVTRIGRDCHGVTPRTFWALNRTERETGAKTGNLLQRDIHYFFHFSSHRQRFRFIGNVSPSYGLLVAGAYPALMPAGRRRSARPSWQESLAMSSTPSATRYLSQPLYFPPFDPPVYRAHSSVYVATSAPGVC
jgi:hypothetical protein